MTSLDPPADFERARLVTAPLARGTRIRRISKAHHVDPLGFRKTPSRFSDPRVDLDESGRFGVVYFAQTLYACFVEAVLRDKAVGRVGPVPIELSELESHSVAHFDTNRELDLLDLREDGALRMRIPTDVAQASDHTLARRWAVAIHAHPRSVDGVIYRSRLNGEENIALFDRAVTSGRLDLVSRGPLLAEPGLGWIIDRLGIEIIDPRAWPTDDEEDEDEETRP